MSYYGYQQRVKADQKAVDYGQIQTGLNKAFEEIQTQQADKREARETDIAELRTDVNKELEQAREAATTNKGDDTFNAQVLSMANQSAQHMRALENLLRAGKINPSDYAIQRQNLIDSVTQLRVVTAAYKDSINQAVTRQEDGIAGKQEAFMMSKVQGVLDFKNHQLMIDPTSGMVRMASLKPNDNTSLGIGEVQVRMMNKYDKYDFTSKVGEYAKLLDTVIEDNGYVRTENPFSLAGGRNLEASIRDNFVGGISDNDKASILLDNDYGYKELDVDNQDDYDAWRSKEEAKMKSEYSDELTGKELDEFVEKELDKYIWYKPNSELGGRTDAVLSDGAKEAVVEKAIQEVKAQTKYSKTITPRDKSAAQIEKEQKRELTIQEAKSNLNLLHDIYTGDEGEKNRALAAYSAELKAQYKGFDNIKIDNNQLVISYKGLVTKDGKKQIVTKTERIDIDKESFKKFAQTVGKAILGNNNLISLYDEASVGIDNLDSPFTAEAGGFTVETEVEEETGIPAQELKEWSEMVDLLASEEMDDWYASNPNKKADAFTYLKYYTTISDIDNFSYRMDGDDLIMSLEGFPDEKIENFYASNDKEVKDALSTKLRKIHKQAKKGVASAEGSGTGSKYNT